MKIWRRVLIGRPQYVSLQVERVIQRTLKAWFLKIHRTRMGADAKMIFSSYVQKNMFFQVKKKFWWYDLTFNGNIEAKIGKIAIFPDFEGHYLCYYK